MSQYDMIAFIVLVVMIASVLRAFLKYRGEKRIGTDETEVRQLRDEVKVLKERLGVLERITVEKENSLAREIENLRDRAPS